jgi:signal transduction histidine kinase
MRVLLIEDNMADAALVTELLREHSPDEFELTHCSSLQAAHRYLDTASADCALVDLSLPDSAGLEGVDQLHERHRMLPLVVLTGNPDDQLALRAVYRGAQDYLVKRAADAGQIARAIRYAVERKRAEHELEEAKDRFFAAVSHDLRTPLACIIGYLEELMVGEAESLTPQVRSFLEIVTVNAERLSRLVNDVLFMACARGDAPDLERTHIDLGSVARMAVEAVRPFAVEKRLELSVVCAPLQPVWADADRMGQVLDNLLSNAIRYTPAGGRVAVRVFPTHAGPAVEVADSGVGIGPEERDHVFEFFYRAPTARETAAAGVGLGLSIVNTIVHAHGGRVTVDSQPGAGSRFTVTLPAAAATDGAAA